MTHYEASFYDGEQNLILDSYLFESGDISSALSLVSSYVAYQISDPDRDKIASVSVEEYDEEDDDGADAPDNDDEPPPRAA